MQGLITKLTTIGMMLIPVFLSGCSYFFDYDIQLKGCFPSMEYSISAADEPIYQVTFFDPNNSLIAEGYTFHVFNFYTSSSSIAENGELVFEHPAPMSGRYSMNGDIVISVPGWSERYLGGSAISVNFPVEYKEEKGIFSAYMMGDSGIALPQGIRAHCKQEIAEVCEGRYCRFLKYLDIDK